MGIDVFTPWPTSGFFATMVTMPSGVMRMNAFGVNAVPVGLPCATASATSPTAVASSSPPPASALTRRNERRSRVGAMVYSSPPGWGGAAVLVGTPPVRPRDESPS